MEKQEREVSLKGLLIYVAKGWKCIIIFMLLFAILLGGFGIIKIKRDSSVPEEELISVISQPDKEVVKKLLAKEAEKNRLKDYMKNSYLMSLNPYKVYKAEITYFVDTNKDINYGGITEKDLTHEIVLAYTGNLKNDFWKKPFAEAKDTDLQYFNELFEIEENDSTFTVKITYPNDKGLEKIMNGIKKQTQDFKSKVEEMLSPHELVLMSSSKMLTVDFDLSATQGKNMKTLNDLESEIETSLKGLSKAQNVYYEELTTEETEDSLNEPLKQHSPSPFNVKYFILGALLGAVIICGVRTFIFIFNDNLYPDDSFEEYLGIKEIGRIEENKEGKRGLFKAIDDFIDSFQKTSIKGLERRSQIGIAFSNILLYCRENNISKVYFNNPFKSLGKEMDAVIAELNKEGIEGVVISDILEDVRLVNDLKENESIIFIEKAENSTYKSLERRIKFCKDHNKSVLGLIVEI